MGQTSGFSNLGASADDNLQRNNEEVERLKDLALVPDPPAALLCRTCDFKAEKNNTNMGMMCPKCGTPTYEAQLQKATDFDILSKLMNPPRTK